MSLALTIRLRYGICFLATKHTKTKIMIPIKFCYASLCTVTISCLLLLSACQQDEVGKPFGLDETNIEYILQSPDKMAFLVEHLHTQVSTADAALMFEAFRGLTSEEYQDFERLRYESQTIGRYSQLNKERYWFRLELNQLSANLFGETPANLSTVELQATVDNIAASGKISADLAKRNDQNRTTASCSPWAFDAQEALPVGGMIEESFASEFRWCSYEGLINVCNLQGQCSSDCDVLLHSATYKGDDFSPLRVRPLTWGAYAILYYSQNGKGVTHDQLIWYDPTSDYEATYSQVVVSRYWLELVYGYFALDEVAQLLASHVIVELAER